MAGSRFDIVVADSSALVALATCDALKLLDSLIENFSVPTAVFREVTVEGKPQADLLRSYLRSKVESVETRRIVLEVGSLGRGELEAMALAKTRGADFLLMDDDRARRVARFNGISVIGSLGILLLAKQEGLIAGVLPFLRILQDSQLFYSESLLDRVRQLAEE